MFRLNQDSHAKALGFLVFIANIFALCLLSLYSFNYNPGRLLTGLDGPTLVSASEEQLSFFGISPHFHSNVLEGLGNTSYSFNLTMAPSVFDYHTGTYSLAIFFTWFTIQLFVSALLMGWNYGFSSRINYLAAWLLTILAFPFFNSFRIYSITEATPHFAEFILVFTILNIGIYKIGSVSWKNSLVYGAVILFGLVAGLIACPTFLIIMAPLLFLTTLHSFITSANRADRTRKLVMGIIILIIAIALGWLHFLLGLVSNTVAKVFYSDLTGPYHSLNYVSMLFQGQTPSSGWGPVLFCTSTLGMLWAIFRSNRFRSLAVTILIAQLLIVCGGYILMNQTEAWVGPSPIYCEVMLFPFYALFTAYLFTEIANMMAWDIPIPRALNLIIPFLISGIVIFAVSLHPPITDRNMARPSSYALPPASTPITHILENEIALNPHSVFAGRVASILTGMDWSKQTPYFLAVDNATGNDHQSTGLWLKHIPTLHEYHHEISPSFYLVYRKFLSDPTETINRNWTNFSQINLPILRLFGVKFIISTSPTINDTKFRSKLKIKNVPTLYLHELTGANIQGISAKRIIRTNSLDEAIKVMARNSFHLSDAIVTKNSEEITRYSPVTNSRISIENEGFHIQAKSKGHSLLILPIEFSHCLHMTSSGEKPKLLRVDVALTAISFNRSVNIFLDNRTGPLANPRCKLKDYNEFNQLWHG